MTLTQISVGVKTGILNNDIRLIGIPNCCGAMWLYGMYNYDYKYGKNEVEDKEKLTSLIKGKIKEHKNFVIICLINNLQTPYWTEPLLKNGFRIVSSEHPNHLYSNQHQITTFIRDHTSKDME